MVNAATETNVPPGTPPPEAEAPAPTETDAAVLAALKQEHEKLQQSYKSVQRSLDAARRSGADISAVLAELQDVKLTMAAVAQALSASDVLGEAKAPLEEAQKRQTEVQALRQRAERVSAEVNELLEPLGVDWGADPRLEEARLAWGQMRFEDAATSVRKVVASMAKKEAAPDVKALVEAELERRLREMGIRKVDTGAATTGGKKVFTKQDITGLQGDAWAKAWEDIKSGKAEIAV